jgi:hypothetical protein
MLEESRGPLTETVRPEREVNYLGRDESQDECAMEEQCSPSKARNVEIRPLDHGYLVTVGCQRVAIESVEKLIVSLERYLKNPDLATQEYYKGKLL